MSIIVDHVDLQFDNGIQLFESLSLQIEPGSWLGVVGPNGSGKTSLARLLNASLVPTHGRVLVDGLDTRDPALHAGIRRQVAVIWADPTDQLVTSSVFDEIAFSLQALGLDRQAILERTTAALDEYGLTVLADAHPGYLAMGEQFRVLFAAACARQARYMVLDEVTGMLDSVTRWQVLEDLERVVETGRTGVLIISHRLEDVERCSEVMVLNDGRLAAIGAPERFFQEVLRHSEWGLALPAVWEVALRLGLEHDGLARGRV